jgi:hypothetical protein
MKASPEMTGTQTDMMGRDGQGRHLMKFRITMGGGLVPHIMALRGECINQALVVRVGASKEPNEDPDVVELARKGLTHAVIVWELLPEHADALVVSGMLMHGTGHFSEAVSFFEKAVYLDPGSERNVQLLLRARKSALEAGAGE